MDLLRRIWNEELFSIGSASFTPGTIIVIIVASVLLVYITGKIKKVLANRIFARYGMDLGVRLAIATIIRYVLLIIGFIIIVQSTGLDLSALGILLGALGIGIGFGLQNITNNFISGIIILFERPIKVGDRIEVGGTHGMVQQISPRATTILTNDNVSIIVPNSEFIASRVINWSHGDLKVRFRISVDVTYDSDVEKVKELLLEVAQEDPDTLRDPEPDVRLDVFGDHGITMTLLAWTLTHVHRRGKYMSNINYRIRRKFVEHDIEIPFPQRDLHLRSGWDDATRRDES